MLLIQDPLYVSGMMTPDRMREIPIDDFVSRITKNGHYEPLQIIWGSDIHLDKGGKLIGNPDEGVSVAQDGTVTMNAAQQKINEGLVETMQNTYSISRFGGKPATDNKEVSPLTAEGLVLTEQIYLPKKLNMNALKKEALLRSDEEEQKLKAEAKLYYAPQSQLQGMAIKDAVAKQPGDDRQRKKLRYDDLVIDPQRVGDPEKKSRKIPDAKQDLKIVHTDSISFVKP
jgi:hypothetical protein